VTPPASFNFGCRAGKEDTRGGHAVTSNEKLERFSIQALKEGPLALAVLANLCGMGGLPMIFGGLAWRVAGLPTLQKSGFF